ncbi:hypothetical protein LPB142_10155 [Rhodobacter xanthinilyticus]|uniref:DUF4157 domain-containing protein n=1 Tax=Rhodobacter xanthinilyticus TaxID=1850250 RepID=A0A1D9MCP8_9RHOB|nr:hypothetical protein [Rhodobacter xanthinilyticus]AOZ69635.1 hypothetical protein LPB142_10155 [Rhodobacter xanthinilyticus]
MRALKLSLLAMVAGGLLGLGALVAFLPVLRGALAPGAYGLAEAAPGVFVEAGMAAPERAALLAEIAAARANVAAFYGPARAHLRILACASAACDRALGGRGAAAVTYSLGPVSVVRLAPRGLGLTILTHELAHTETHARLGLWGQLSGRMPTWFDEGLSVLISQDPRYLGPPPAPCLRPPRADLPQSPFDWAPAAALDRMLYAEAACAVYLWAEARGGRAAVLAALAAGARLP